MAEELGLFVDEELVALRKRQREALAVLPDRFVKEDLSGLPATLAAVTAEHPGLVERNLRDLAAGYLERLESVIENHRAMAKLNGTVAVMTPFASTSSNWVLGELADKVRAARGAMYAKLEVPDESYMTALTVIPLLAWADALADDGYCDPRLSTPG